ncbi:hypothetical protein H8B09_02375 [Paenibacillus sp. PR3]|uniref:Uncharacterized protein n=1 Tax=Paenibacillus terricola TaxID=2763503 RepID=A0ABR8MNJ5_9BACL|nr:ABC-three component system middle component 1 [Paenibacillus terricola]MBD3917585.1 hypothetical protein [Paenibacillus terricola]
MIIRVKKHLEDNGFNPISEESKFRKHLEELGLDDVYLNKQENEMYIVKSKDEPMALDEVQIIINKIAGFTLLFPNISLSYNINLVLICPLNKKQVDNELLDGINRLNIERNKYYCRKFVLNSSAKNTDEEIDILPIRAISLHIKEQFNGYDGLNRNVSNVLGDAMFEELSKPERPELDQILKFLEIE